MVLSCNVWTVNAIYLWFLFATFNGDLLHFLVLPLILSINHSYFTRVLCIKFIEHRTGSQAIAACWRFHTKFSRALVSIGMKHDLMRRGTGWHCRGIVTSSVGEFITNSWHLLIRSDRRPWTQQCFNFGSFEFYARRPMATMQISNPCAFVTWVCDDCWTAANW